MTLLKRTVLSIFALLTPLFIFAQQGRYFNSNNQLSTSMVTNSYQDHNGMIWIATNNGINSYDGYQFRIYNKGNKEGELSSNVVNGFMQSADGTLYIALDNALMYLRNGKFINVKGEDGNNITGHFRDICLTSKGELITGASARTGLLRVIDGKAKWTMVGNNKVGSPQKIREDAYGTLWVVTEDKGVVAIHDRSVRQLFGNSELSNGMTDICFSKSGMAYVACHKGGVYMVDAKHVFSGNTNTYLIPGTEHLPVISIHADKRGNILIGTDGNGLYEYNPATKNLQRYAIYSTELNLNMAKVTNIMEDHEGNIWLSMLQKGIFMIPATQNMFHYQGYQLGSMNAIGEACVACVYQTADGRIWVSTDGDGLFALTAQGKLIHHFTTATFPSAILSITEDHQHRLWIGSYLNGCGWIDTETGSYHRLSFTYGKAQSVFDMVEDKSHNLWIGTLGDGLKCYNLDNGNITEMRSNSANDIANNYIVQLTLSPDGNRLYAANSTGLSCYDLQHKSWTSVFGSNVLLDRLPVVDAKEDHSGLVWVCTYNGMYVYDIKHHHTDTLTTAQGLADNNTASVQIDAKGRAWVSTIHGISRITTKRGDDGALTYDIENYYLSDGLQGNEFCWGVSNKSVIAGKETLLFGGMYGLTWFTPSNISHNSYTPKIFITGITIGDREIHALDKSGFYTITEDDINSSDEFDLCHDDNSITISLSTLSYTNTEKVTFAYSINNEPWTTLPPGKNTIALSHLQSGTYNFRIKAKVGDCESEIKKLSVTVHPAWYFSAWAKLIYILLGILIAWWYLRLQRSRHQDELRLQEHIHAEEMGESKLRFFMNISHEIRTPLTLIISPMEELIQNDADPMRRSIYKTVYRNALRILNQVNMMMDMRKIDAGKMVLHTEPTNIVKFTQDVITLFEQQAKVKNINISFQHSADDIYALLDRSNFDKVLVNILSNAFKYTHTGGNIIINISTEETESQKQIVLAVSDDGEMIPTDKLEKIFERFYQTTSVTNDRQAGTGIGLDLTRSLVLLHHGTIAAHNNQQKGCTFTVKLPLYEGEVTKTEDVAADKPKDLFMPTEEELTIKHEKAITAPLLVIAEDDTEILNYLSQELGSGFRIIECSNGRTALTATLKHKPDLVISDIMMPEMDGNELCTRIKHNVNTNSTPVILLTAKTREEDKLMGLETGADAYITKPFNMDILKRTIINLINSRKVMRNKAEGQEEQHDKIDEVKLQSPDEKLMQRIMAVINNNLTNEDLSVQFISQEVGISRVHLYRKMKELTNQTPHDFIRNIRLKQAANLLANGRHNITEVMYACGFNNSASFSTQFKKMYGVPPREYMKENN